MLTTNNNLLINTGIFFLGLLMKLDPEIFLTAKSRITYLYIFSFLDLIYTAKCYVG